LIFGGVGFAESGLCQTVETLEAGGRREDNCPQEAVRPREEELLG